MLLLMMHSGSLHQDLCVQMRWHPQGLNSQGLALWASHRLARHLYFAFKAGPASSLGFGLALRWLQG